MGTEDLDEAYGQCPARPDQRNACIVAWHSPSRGWRFAEAKGLVFGLSAAVVGFNRWPALITAGFRRFFAGLGANYFDDFFALSSLIDAAHCRCCLSDAAAFNGGSFGKAKAIPPGQHRAFIGVSANLDTVASGGVITLFPREECIRSIRTTALDMLGRNVCTPAAASKLRGKAGWASTSLFAKLGRIGLSALKDRQYNTNHSPLLNQELKEALQFLSHIDQVPPRTIDLRAPRLPPLVIYSDASWPSRMDGSKEITIPRIGWIIFVVEIEFNIVLYIEKIGNEAHSRL